jgi:hypothetical protein
LKIRKYGRRYSMKENLLEDRENPGREGIQNMLRGRRIG